MYRTGCGTRLVFRGSDWLRPNQSSHSIHSTTVEGAVLNSSVQGARCGDGDVPGTAKSYLDQQVLTKRSKKALTEDVTCRATSKPPLVGFGGGEVAKSTYKQRLRQSPQTLSPTKRRCTRDTVGEPTHRKPAQSIWPMSLANAEVRVCARGTSASQASARNRLSAIAVIRC